MKPIAIISLIVLSCIGIGLFQQQRLTGLQQQSAEITGEITQGLSVGKPVLRPRSGSLDFHPTAEISSQESVTKLAALLIDMAQKADARLAKVKSGLPITQEEQADLKECQDQLFRGFALLDSVEILTMIRQLESNPNLPDALRKNPAEECVGILMEVNPKVLLDVVPSLKDYPATNAAMNGAFYNWLRASPVAAVKWFDDAMQKGDPVARSPGFLNDVILEEVRQDPAHALTRALSQEAEGDPQSIASLGANIAQRLDEVDENLAFFSALRQQIGKSPDSAALARIRAYYVSELGDRLYQWPFASAVALLDTDFTAAEKATAARGLFRGYLDEREKWATWIIGLAPPAEGESPLKDFISGWFQADPLAAAKWLEQAPPGELKDQLLEKYAGAMSGG